ncbi:MAG: glycosyltransferase [Desulfurococcaceae archaeon]
MLDNNQRTLGYLSGAPSVSTRDDAPKGGPRTHVLGVIRGFERAGWHVLPYIVGDRIPLKTYRVGPPKGSMPNKIVFDLARTAMGYYNRHQAFNELRGKVDWVYERLSTFQALGYPFRRVGVPWILETQGIFYREAKVERNSIALGTLAKRIETAAYHNCNVIISVSTTLKELLVDEVGVTPDKILVIPNGVDIVFFDPANYQPKRLFGGFTIGFVGALISWQALELLFDAVYDLRNDGLDMHVAVIGEGDIRQALEERVRSLGLHDRVRFLGSQPRSEIGHYLAGFDVGYSGQIHTSHTKMYHSPLKLYEYMAMAVPPVASAYEDAQATITDSVTGYLFEPGNKEDLKRALRKAYDNRKVLSSMGLRARQTVIERHSWDARVKQMIEGIEAILGQQ